MVEGEGAELGGTEAPVDSRELGIERLPEEQVSLLWGFWQRSRKL
jgi:hypothetical protein